MLGNRRWVTGSPVSGSARVGRMGRERVGGPAMRAGAAFSHGAIAMGVGTVSSRSGANAGSAVQMAAGEGRRKPVKLAARELEAAAWLNIRLQMLSGGDWRSAFVIVGAPLAAVA